MKAEGFLGQKGGARTECLKIPEGQRHLAHPLPETSSSLVSFSAVHPRQLERLVLRVCWNLGA